MIFNWFNTISIDIPSGISADGFSCIDIVKSKFTLTFGYSKLGHYLSPINNLSQLNIGFKSISTNIQKVEYSDISNILKVINNYSTYLIFE